MIRSLFFFYTLCFCLNTRAQQSPLDKARQTLQGIRKPMAAKFETYRQRYAADTLQLKALTLYEYNPEGQLLYEKGYGPDQCNLYVYKDKQVVEKLYEMLGSLSLELNTYDKDGTLTEKKSYTDYFPKNERTETYSSKQVDHSTKDTVTVISYTNGYPIQRSVYIYDDTKKLRHMLSYQPAQDTLPSFETSYGYDPGSKQILRYTTRMRKLDYHKETTLRYTKDDLEVSSLTKDLISGKTEETLNYYNQKQLVKEEEFKDGKLEFTRTYEYDKKGNMICETAREASGNLRYRCRYEYDAKGNKISYLYFYGH